MNILKRILKFIISIPVRLLAFVLFFIGVVLMLVSAIVFGESFASFIERKAIRYVDTMFEWCEKY